MDDAPIMQLAYSLEDAFFLLGLAMLLIELAKSYFERTFKGRTMLGIVASVSTQIPTVLAETFLMFGVYLGFVVLSENVIPWVLPINTWTIVAVLIAADFIYYWEHRLAHEIRLFWTQHAVHHSGREMNIAVAVRFGPLEGVISAILHLPLVVIGFPAELVFFAIIAVLAYQVWIHTELIGKLPILDSFLNTPANHRVHHGCDDKYIDKNYGGITVIWDRIFGTYQREEETPRYGLKRDFESVNPFVVWFSELPKFVRDVAGARSWRETFMYVFGPPGWKPKEPAQPLKEQSD
ncbi:MAG: sterol desaturase family protein [Pseudomonadota bacterium]